MEAGHINSTFRNGLGAGWQKEVRYILQKINTDIFKNPVSLMKNIEGVTEFLRNRLPGGMIRKRNVKSGSGKKRMDYPIRTTRAILEFISFIEMQPAITGSSLRRISIRAEKHLDIFRDC